DGPQSAGHKSAKLHRRIMQMLDDFCLYAIPAFHSHGGLIDL
ncbi:17161_t:CDS:2, partial [Dentiscutata heterogama]